MSVATFALASAVLQEGDPCSSKKPAKPGSSDVATGTCKQVGECKGNWIFGLMEGPVCGPPNSDYKEAGTLVCCLDE